MLTEAIAFLVMLNPFGLFIYLQPIMKELSHRDFTLLLVKANVISFAIYSIFLASGTFIFKQVFQIDFESFRIFGGIIIFAFAFLFIVRGQRAYITLKEDITKMAAEVSMPFMVGAGTISITLLIGHHYPFHIGFIGLAGILAANFLFLMFLKAFRQSLELKLMREAFDKNLEILLRLNGFFLGAIGVNMVITGINNLYF